MKNFIIPVVAFSSFSILSACGGGGSEGLAAYIANAPENTLAAAFAENRTLPGAHARTMEKDFGDGQSTTVLGLTSATVTVDEDAETLTVVLNGDEVVFVDGDQENVFGFNRRDIDGEYSSLFSQSGALDEAPLYFVTFDGSTNLENGVPTQPEEQTVFIIGAETPDDVIAGLSDELQYFGGGRINIYPAEGFDFIPPVFVDGIEVEEGYETRGTIRGWTAFTADLNEGTFSGIMGDIIEGSDDDLDIVFDSGEGDLSFTLSNAQIIFEDAEITGNTFAGTMDTIGFGDCCDAYGVPLTEGLNASEYSGGFYGPDADGVGLTLSGSASADGSTINVIGTASGQLD